MKFKDYEFGFADAEKEFIRVPEIFEKAFYDENNVVERLIDKYHFLLVGRKGVGKSAYSAKIQSLAQSGENLFAYPLKLNDFEFSTFAKTSVDNDVLGTQKYKASWDFILLLIGYKILYNNLNIKEVEGVNDIIYLLDELGFSLEPGYKRDISRLSKIKLGGSIGKFDVSFEKEFGTKPSTYLERITSLNERMLDILSDVWFDEEKVVILIDGVDDILRFKKNQLDILSSLVRSVDYLNDKFLCSKIPFKIVLFIREDILSSITDPDLNKIKRDGSITLNWQNSIEDLKEIVKLRFNLSGVPNEKLDTWWERLFPRKIRDKESWLYVLDYTLCKPRDILQFLKCCQEVYPNNVSLSFSEMEKVLKVYSSQYFIEEMKNEVTGFISDDLINVLPAVLQKLGSRSFTYADFCRDITTQCLIKDVDEKDIKYLLLLLFEAGYIGQLFSNDRHQDIRDSVIFKHRNPTTKIDYTRKFITHKGLHSGLGVRL